MAARYRLGPTRRAINGLVTALVRVGLGPRGTHLLTAPGRRTGRSRTTPVTLVEDGSQRWLVAPYGEVGWVWNARQAGWVHLRRGGRTERVSVVELGAEASAPILRRYVSEVPITRPFFEATPASDLVAFQAEAGRHPVFEIGEPARLERSPVPARSDGTWLLWPVALAGLAGIGLSALVVARAAPPAATMLAVTTIQGVLLAGLLVLTSRLVRHLSEARARLEVASITDGLTGLANRRYLLRRADEECARIGRTRERVGVGFVLVDIDHFRRINERHGHPGGDAVLRELARLLLASTRRYDVVGRYGGEQFLLILPHADFQESEGVAQRVWTRVRQGSFATIGGPERLTVSVGVACATVGTESVTAALRRAEERLRRAKAAGRDRVVAL